MTSVKPERQLLIFWRYPADRLEETLAKVRERFDIDYAVYIRWTPERIVENFQRFYAMVSDHAYKKYTEAGTAPFLFLLVTDNNPVYQYRIAGGSGFKKVNIKSFDLKQDLRRQGGTSLHATNNEREFRRDLMYLMGQPAHEFKPPQWDGKIDSIKEIHQDIVAADGWTDLRQVFAVLNEAVDYVVLRNFTKLPDEHIHGDHGDIDLLVEDVDARNRAASILNKEQRAHTIVSGRKVYVDFRSVEDFYYDPKWCRDILRQKIMVRGFYVPDPENHFFSLLYHGHVQKPKISKDYIPKLMELAQEIGLDWITPEWVTDPDKAAKLLADWLKGKGYYLTRPNGCPQYNPQFVAKVENAPFLHQSASNFYREIAAASGANGSAQDLLEQIRQFEANFMSRRFLLRAFVHRMKSYPREFLRNRIMRS